jgi:type IX secretion system PorP/SprF family membrane protein
MAQDIHFSQFLQAPNTINPALTGKIPFLEMDQNLLRIGANFKNQGASIGVPYRTYSASIDGTFSPAKMQKSQIGLGLLFYNDNAGDGSLQNSSAMLNMAFTRGFNRFNTFTATLGFSIGFINSSVDFTKLVFDNQWNGIIFDPEASSLENFSSHSIFAVNFNFGGLIKYEINPNIEVQLGSSLNHINKPRTSFYDADNRIDQKLIIHANATIITERNVIINPAILFSQQSLARETVVGSNLSFNKRDLQFILGLWYRINSDLIPLVGINFNAYRFAISYDINTSPLRLASNYKGGVELSLTKVFRKRGSRAECSGY